MLRRKTMSKLKEVIEEMGGYSDMGGMRSADSIGMMGRPNNGNKLKAYKLSDLLDPRNRNRAEEEEDLEPMDDMDMDMDMDTDMNAEGDDVEETKQFFLDNPEPSDEDIAMYAEERGMDMEDMRKAVYRLIRSLLATESPDDEMDVDMDDEDSLDFSVSGDTGERPATNELK